MANTRTQEKNVQITCPLLVSMSDQGGINRAGLSYLVYKLKLAVAVQFDPFHRGWNDLKASLKSVFKPFLALSLLFNCNYGPSGSKEWFSKKKALATDIVTSSPAHQEPFLIFIPWIC